MPEDRAYREGMWAVSPYNFDESVRAGMHLPAQVQVTDLTLREGRQVGGVSLRLEDVLEYARRVDAVGIPIVEMHHDDPEEIRQVKNLGLDFKIQVLIHPTAALNPVLCRREIDHSLDVGADILCLALAISDYNHRLVESMGGLQLTREQAIDLACEAVQYGKQKGATMCALLMDFTRLDLGWLKEMVRQFVAAGAGIVRLDDICAPCLPAVYRHHTWEVKQVAGDTPLAIHTHEDFGLALAGQLAALEGGAEILDGTVNGLGERAGITNLAALIPALELLYGYRTGIRLDALQELSEFVADVWNQPVPPRFAGVGRDAFSHSAEVHYVLPEGGEWAFNAWAPAVVGNRAYVPLCQYSGPRAIQRKAREEGLGELTLEQARRALDRVRAELRLRRTELSDRLFAQIVQQATAITAGQ